MPVVLEYKQNFCRAYLLLTLFIEIAVTSFIGDEKRAFINKLGVKTIEIDLSAFVDMELDIPNQFLHDYIVNHLDNKTWIYPKGQIVSQNLALNNSSTKNFLTNLTESTTMSNNNPIFTVTGLQKHKGRFYKYGELIEYDNLIVHYLMPFSDSEIAKGARGLMGQSEKIKGSADKFHLYENIEFPCQAEFVFEIDFSTKIPKRKLTQVIFMEG